MTFHYSRPCSVQIHNREMKAATTKHCNFSVWITLHPPTKISNGRKTKVHATISIANGPSRLILACSHTQPNNFCDMCVQGKGNKAIAEVIWAESVMVQWQYFVLDVEQKHSEASKWEWKDDKWQATQITLSRFYCISEPRLLGCCVRHHSIHTVCLSW